MTLQRLRGELTDVSDEELQTDLMASIADIRNQLYVAQEQCKQMMDVAQKQQMMDTDLLDKHLLEKDIEQVSVSSIYYYLYEFFIIGLIYT